MKVVIGDNKRRDKNNILGISTFFVIHYIVIFIFGGKNNVRIINVLIVLPFPNITIPDKIIIE